MVCLSHLLRTALFAFHCIIGFVGTTYMYNYPKANPAKMEPETLSSVSSLVITTNIPTFACPSPTPPSTKCSTSCTKTSIAKHKNFDYLCTQINTIIPMTTELKHSIKEVIENVIPDNHVFTSHTVIEYLIQQCSKQYVRGNNHHLNMKDYHGEIGAYIAAVVRAHHYV